MKRILAAMVLAVAASAAIPALAATWTDPSTGIEWTYRGDRCGSGDSATTRLD